MELPLNYIPNIPEIIWKIFLDLDYESILNLCATSKTLAQYCDVFPLWALKAEKDFAFPRQLFDRTDLTARRRYLQVMDYKGMPSTYIKIAAGNGDLDLVKWLVTQGIGSVSLDYALHAAAIGGHLPVVQFLANHGAGKLADVSLAASFSGHLPVVQWLVEAQDNESVNVDNFKIMLNRNLEFASSNGRLPVVQWLVQRGATNIYHAVIVAAKPGHISIVQWLAENENIDKINALNYALTAASRYGNLRMVKWLVEYGATNIGGALEQAILANRIQVIDYLRSL